MRELDTLVIMHKRNVKRIEDNVIDSNKSLYQ